MVPNKRSWFSLVGAAFFGAALTFGMGANNPKAPAAPAASAVPKYSVYNQGPFLHITDNDTNKQYIYLNNADQPSKLLGYIDLTQTGQAEIKAVKAEKVEKADK